MSNLEVGRSLSSIVFVLCLFGSLVFSASAQDEPERLNERKAQALARDILGADARRADRAVTAWKASAPEDWSLVMKALREGVSTPGKKSRAKSKGSFYVKVPCPEAEGGAVNVHIALPRGYKHGKPWPMVIRSHGAGMDGTPLVAAWEEMGSVKDRLIAVTPDFPFPDPSKTINPWDERVHGIYQAVRRYMFENYSIDGDRVYLSGYFMGAGFSFLYAQVHPQDYAGLHASGRLYLACSDLGVSCESARKVPGYFIIGATDAPDRVEGHTKVAEYYKKCSDYVGRFVVVPDAGRQQPFFFDHDERAMSFLLEKARVKYPKEFTVFVPSPAAADCYWIRPTTRGTNNVVKAKVDGQTIEITSGETRNLKIRLADEIVDLDQPITVKQNGRVVFEGKVERSIDHVLEQLDESHDPRLLYWATIEVK